MEEDLLFRDALVLLSADGVSPDLVRAGEPRLRRYSTRSTSVPAPAGEVTRAPRLRRVLRAATS